MLTFCYICCRALCDFFKKKLNIVVSGKTHTLFSLLLLSPEVMTSFGYCLWCTNEWPSLLGVLVWEREGISRLWLAKPRSSLPPPPDYYHSPQSHSPVTTCSNCTTRFHLLLQISYSNPKPGSKIDYLLQIFPSVENVTRMKLSPGQNGSKVAQLALSTSDSHSNSECL